MGDHFGDSWYGLGFSSYHSLDPSLLARSTGGKEREKGLEGGSPLPLLDSLARKEQRDF